MPFPNNFPIGRWKLQNGKIRATLPSSPVTSHRIDVSVSSEINNATLNTFTHQHLERIIHRYEKLLLLKYSHMLRRKIQEKL
eukprot:scaffold39160_cov275-Amphora_coffeaeformis.AAC.2